jgi:hypothetical protein
MDECDLTSTQVYVGEQGLKKHWVTYLLYWPGKPQEKI